MDAPLRINIPEHRTRLPKPLTEDQIAKGHSPAYADREVFTRVLPARELAQWTADVVAVGGDGIIAGAVSGNALAAARALTKFDGKSLMLLLDRFIRHTVVTFGPLRMDLSRPEAFDEAFTGEGLFLVDLVRWLFEVNYESFRRGLPDARAKAGASNSTSPTG